MSSSFAETTLDDPNWPVATEYAPRKRKNTMGRVRIRTIDTRILENPPPHSMAA
jgi:hypothetical protein